MEYSPLASVTRVYNGSSVKLANAEEVYSMHWPISTDWQATRATRDKCDRVQLKTTRITYRHSWYLGRSRRYQHNLLLDMVVEWPPV
jgi:hypothetical protein